MFGPLAYQLHSKVFTNMASSCRTIIPWNDYSYIQDELKGEVQKAMFLSLMADISTDMSVFEQLILYLGSVDMASEKIVTHFAGIPKI